MLASKIALAIPISALTVEVVILQRLQPENTFQFFDVFLQNDQGDDCYPSK